MSAINRFRETEAAEFGAGGDASRSSTSADACELSSVDWRTEGEKVRKQLLETLASRRTGAVPFALPSKHARKPFLQREISDLRWTMTMRAASVEERCGSRDEIQEENLLLSVEVGRQEQVPVLILKPKLSESERQSGQVERKPALIFLHWTGADKEMMRPHMQIYASQGYVAVAIDSRYHGERADSVHAYADGLVCAWRTGQEMPFIFDTVRVARHGVFASQCISVWDLMRLIDYLVERADVCPTRIGVVGLSLGGMHAWFAAAADPRVAVAVCLLGVQSFGWAIENNAWHARVASIAEVFAEARKDLGKAEVDAETVAAVWHRIAPGLVDKFDAEHTLPAIAPRPLLILNGKEDMRCPMAGLEKAVARTAQAYRQADAADNFEFVAEEGVGHSVCEAMAEKAHAWLQKHLQSGPKSSEGEKKM